MATFAQIVGNAALNVITGDDIESARVAHFVEGYDGGHLGVDWALVPNEDVNGYLLISGAVTANGGVSFTNPDFSEKPNNAGNPYFPGYVPKGPDQFWGLVQQVFIALQGSNAAGADRFSRLVNSSRASGVVKIISAVDLINPDDKQGAFLRELGFLTTTNHETDSAVLMTDQEVAAIMQKQNWAS